MTQNITIQEFNQKFSVFERVWWRGHNGTMLPAIIWSRAFCEPDTIIPSVFVLDEHSHGVLCRADQIVKWDTPAVPLDRKASDDWCADNGGDVTTSNTSSSYNPAPDRWLGIFTVLAENPSSYSQDKGIVDQTNKCYDALVAKCGPS